VFAATFSAFSRGSDHVDNQSVIESAAFAHPSGPAKQVVFSFFVEGRQNASGMEM